MPHRRPRQSELSFALPVCLNDPLYVGVMYLALQLVCSSHRHPVWDGVPLGQRYVTSAETIRFTARAS